MWRTVPACPLRATSATWKWTRKPAPPRCCDTRWCRIGWALNEEYIYGEDGRLQNPGFLDYRIPVCSDLPFIDTEILEIPNPNHPYGVRGVGETSIVPPLAAIANAVSNAVGVRMTHVPMSPPRILKALDEAGAA